MIVIKSTKRKALAVEI